MGVQTQSLLLEEIDFSYMYAFIEAGAFFLHMCGQGQKLFIENIVFHSYKKDLLCDSKKILATSFSNLFMSTLFGWSLQKNALSAGFRICWLYPLQKVKTLLESGILGMTLGMNCI